MGNPLNFTADLLPGNAALLSQLVAALGNPIDGSNPLQAVCDAAANDVLRLTTGYALDATSLTNFTRALALYNAYALAGPVQPDIKTIYEDTMRELTEIARGNRPNLPKVAVPAQSLSSGGFGGYPARIHGRINPREIQQ